MLVLLLTIPFAGALLLYLLRARRIGNPQTVALLATGAANALLLWMTLQWNRESPPIFQREWIPEFGLSFSLWLDGPALFWAWLVLGVGFLVVQYSKHYLEPDDSPWRFYSILLAFMGSMLGVVIARNLLFMFIFWEMTSLTSFLLIGHWHQKDSARLGAKRALIVTGLGGLCLLAGIGGILYILSSGGMELSLEWDYLWSQKEFIATHPSANWVMVLVLLGALTKSAQFPFHVWLPGAMEAPTPVSAYLHAATMVKAGIYLLGRLYPIFHTLDMWLYIVAGIGVLTMFVGGFIAIVSHDLKLLLAWSTVSQLGLIASYYGFGFAPEDMHEKLLTLDLLLVASHALFKAGLFMLIGVIDHATHTRDWTKLGGLFRKMPASAVLTAIGCASMAGYPLTFGFVAKKLYLKAADHVHAPGSAHWIEHVLYWGAVAASVLTVAYCLRLAILPYYGRVRSRKHVDHAHEGSPGFLFAPAVLIIACLAAGLYVPLLEKPLSVLVRGEFYKLHSHYNFAFFHLNEIDLNFWVSVIMLVVAGPLVFAAGAKIERVWVSAGKPSPWYWFFDNVLDKWITGASVKLEKEVQHISLRRNTAIMVVALVAALGAALYKTNIPDVTIQYDHVGPIIATSFAVLCIVLVVVTVIAHKPLMRLLSMSFIGLIVAGIFALYKAPDLVITQVLVELVIFLMFLLLLPVLKRPERRVSSVPQRTIGIVVAIAGGLLMGTLTYFASNSDERFLPAGPNPVPPAEFYLANSKHPQILTEHSGGGSNVVNVILVDFRGMDTLGEITVLVIAALGVAIMMSGFRRKKEKRGETPSQKISIFTAHEFRLPKSPLFMDFHPQPGFATVMRVLAPLVFVFLLCIAFTYFLAGHNAPGGGFIAGLLTAASLVPFFISYRRREPMRPDIDYPLIFLPIGIFVAALTGLIPILTGHEFMHSHHEKVFIPLLGNIEVASAMFFDMGVYFVVIGVALLILKKFGKA